MKRDDTKSIKVAWYGTRGNSLEVGPPFHIVETALGSEAAELSVIDIRACETIAEVKRVYSSIKHFVVLVVDTIEEETAVLAWLKAGDETCRRDAVQQQLGLLLHRGLDREQNLGSSTAIDSLTGLASRTALMERAKRLLSSIDSTESICTIFFEIDGFKHINDRFGHVTGDAVLKELGRLLKQYARGAEIIARIGGDEFIVVLRGNLEQGRAFAEFLRTQIAAHEFGADAREIKITASFGVTSMNQGDSFEDAVREADQSMYTAKIDGRNRVVTVEEAKGFADAAGQDMLISDFENRLKIAANRMAGDLMLKFRRLANQFRAEADHDSLTGIFNRRHLDRLLSRQFEQCRNQNKRLAVALLDLDHFGEVNRTYGFPTGDRALKSAATALKQNVRALDWVARYGGEEFCVVMPDTDLATAREVAERVRQALKSQTVQAWNGEPFQITASIGVVELAEDDADTVTLFQRASDKVREAKESGRDQIRS